jgi:small GTP-binding protein
MLDYKCVLMGSSGVGKTTIFNSISNINTYQVSPTVGPTSQTKIVKLGNAPINIKLLDMSGNERYRKISREYFKHSERVILVFDLTNRKTFEELTDWTNDIRDLCDKEVSGFFIGNKKDLASKRKVMKKEASDFAANHNLKYLEISSFQKRVIQKMFRNLITKINSNQCLAGFKVQSCIQLINFK